MTTEKETEIEKLIVARFDRIDRKLENQINEIKIEIVKVESRLSQEINKVDVNWIKWLFGGLLSAIFNFVEHHNYYSF